MDTEYLETAYPQEPETPSPTAPTKRPGWATALIAVGVLILAGQAVLAGLLINRAGSLEESVAANAQGIDGVDARIDRLGSVVGVLTGRLDSLEASGVSAAPAVETTADGLPPFTQGEADPALGMTLGEFSAEDWTSGEIYTVGPSDTSKIVLIWAHWCPYCQQELPIVQGLIDEGALDAYPDIEFVTVTTFEDPSRGNPLDEYLEAEQWDFPVLLDEDESLAARLGVQSVPAWVVLDAEGTVLGRFTGAIPGEQVLGIFEELQRITESG